VPSSFYELTKGTDRVIAGSSTRVRITCAAPSESPGELRGIEPRVHARQHRKATAGGIGRFPSSPKLPALGPAARQPGDFLWERDALEPGGGGVGLGQFGVVGVCGDLEAGVEGQLFQNVVDVTLDRIGGDVESFGDVLVAQALGD
jgi:hypothetical protein